MLAEAPLSACGLAPDTQWLPVARPGLLGLGATERGACGSPLPRLWPNDVAWLEIIFRRLWHGNAQGSGSRSVLLASSYR